MREVPNVMLSRSVFLISLSLHFRTALSTRLFGGKRAAGFDFESALTPSERIIFHSPGAACDTCEGDDGDTRGLLSRGLALDEAPSSKRFKPRSWAQEGTGAMLIDASEQAQRIERELDRLETAEIEDEGLLQLDSDWKNLMGVYSRAGYTVHGDVCIFHGIIRSDKGTEGLMPIFNIPEACMPRNPQLALLSTNFGALGAIVLPETGVAQLKNHDQDSRVADWLSLSQVVTVSSKAPLGLKSGIALNSHWTTLYVSWSLVDGVCHFDGLICGPNGLGIIGKVPALCSPRKHSCDASGWGIQPSRQHGHRHRWLTVLQEWRDISTVERCMHKPRELALPQEFAQHNDD